MIAQTAVYEPSHPDAQPSGFYASSTMRGRRSSDVTMATVVSRSGVHGMKIKAIAPWFGGKRTMATTIVDELGPHRAYFEPFCGSCAVLMEKQKSSLETVNDLHGDLVNLARVLADEYSAERLYERLSRLICCETIHGECRQRLRMDECPDGISVDRAFDYFVASWLGRNGLAGTSGGDAIAVRWNANGGSTVARFASAVDSIPEWHQRLRQVLVLRRDAFELLSRIDDATGTVIYCDPPYLNETRTSRGSGRYVHDFCQSDHQRLAESLSRFKKARIVVSYYDHPGLNRLYPGWSVRRIESVKNMSRTTKNRDMSKTTEVLLVNGPLLGADGDFCLS